MQFIKTLTYAILTILLMTGCYNNTRPVSEFNVMTIQDSTKTDTMSFSTFHHYNVGYNFLVRDDSLCIMPQHPRDLMSHLVIDSAFITKGKQLMVADICIISGDSIDSVWVQVASETGRIGWIHEKDMLKKVVPTDPISQFIMFFSDTHIMAAVIILALLIAAYTFRKISRRNAPIVHFRDIPSFYPTLLCIVVAASATFYASLQMFEAEAWQEFYYHPSLNPFRMAPILSVFISSVWAMLIISVAVLDDVRHHLNFDDALIYLAGLAGMCAMLYIIFSISTLYYIGYPLLIAYGWFAISRYFRYTREKYLCGNCGKGISHKGKCPHCGAINE